MKNASPVSFLSVARTTRPAPCPTKGSCQAAASLGLLLDDLAIAPTPPHLEIPWTPGMAIAIVGPSGSGKSTLLGDIEQTARHRDERVIRPPRVLATRPAIDLFGASVSEAMRRLARVGLGDARALVRRPNELSEGQRARLRIALAMHTIERASSDTNAALLIDEFGAGLDRATVTALSAMLSRWLNDTARKRGVRVVVATTEPQNVHTLTPSVTIHLDAAGRATMQRPTPRSVVRFSMRRGTYGDLRAMAPLHYRAGRPATIVHVLVAMVSGQRAGVLAISMPVLNASWRDLAWPGRFNTGDHRRDAQRINRGLRCISRVIVDPAYRSMGIARRMVEYYLQRPLTRRTEALAAMGHATSFFASAGMTPYDTPPPQRHARLLDAMAHLGIDPWRLATPRLVLERMRSGSVERSMLERELRVWARRSGSTARHADDEVESLLMLAARAVAARPMAYAHTSNRS